MKIYHETEAAAERHLATHSPQPRFPDHQAVLEAFPYPTEVAMPVFGEVKTIPLLQPTPLVTELLRSLHEEDGNQPRSVLDIGCGVGRHGLYMALHGHTVHAVDDNSWMVDRAAATAKAFDIPRKRFTTGSGRLEYMDSKREYDVVIGTMVLHFLDRPKARRVTDQLQKLTRPGGYHAVSVYTTDNPEEESRRGVRTMFEPDELRSLYDSPDWTIKQYTEGLSRKPMSRQFEGQDTKWLVPTTAELIAQKKQPIRSLGRTALQASELEYYRRADPEYYDVLLQMGNG